MHLAGERWGGKCHYRDEPGKHPASSPMRRADERILETNGHGRSEIRRPDSRREMYLSRAASRPLLGVFYSRAFNLPRQTTGEWRSCGRSEKYYFFPFDLRRANESKNCESIVTLILDELGAIDC